MLAVQTTGVCAGVRFTPEMDVQLHDAANKVADLAREWNISKTSALYGRRAWLRSNPPKRLGAPVPAPARKTSSLLGRVEELTSYWQERDFELAKPAELAELLKLLHHLGAERHTILMSLVLTRAEAEHRRRQLGAGKGGVANG